MEGGERSFHRLLNAALRSPDRKALAPWHDVLHLLTAALYALPSHALQLDRALNEVLDTAQPACLRTDLVGRDLVLAWGGRLASIQRK